MKKCIILFSLIFVNTVNIFSQRGEIYQLGTGNNYVAGDFYQKVENYTANQEGQNWCWAACIQMVLQNQGLFIEQCDIVKQGFGQSECEDRTANCYTIQQAGAGWKINGRKIKATVNNNATAHDLINDLAFKYPLVVGLNMPNQNIGHAYVITAIYFKYDSNRKKRPYKVVLRDPWPNNPSRLELEWSDFYNRINCITHITF